VCQNAHDPRPAPIRKKQGCTLSQPMGALAPKTLPTILKLPFTSAAILGWFGTDGSGAGIPLLIREFCRHHWAYGRDNHAFRKRSLTASSQRPNDFRRATFKGRWSNWMGDECTAPHVKFICRQQTGRRRTQRFEIVGGSSQARPRVTRRSRNAPQTFEGGF